jgi:peptide/nickel transport system substrate-binding protein
MRLKWLRLAVPLAALLAFAFAFSSCGGDDDDDDGGGGGGGSGSTGIPEEFAAQTAAPDDAQRGGNLTLISEGDIDYMDPGAAYYQVTYTLDFGLFRQLVSWPPESTEDPAPDLAADEPEISDDGKTITFRIQEGITYSPPLEDREVTSADFKYAIERSLLPGVANGYTTTYMQDIAGMDEAIKAAEENQTVAPDISGIETPDEQTVVFNLDKSSAIGVLGALSLPVSSPVPEEYAKKYDAESPSTYGDHPVFTGPYMVENDGKGNLTGYSPGKEIKLVRNPSWDADTDFRPAYLDSITVQEGFSDPTSAAKKVLEGSGQVTFDFPPSPTVIKEVAQGGQYDASQMAVTPSGGNRYIALNTTEEPFDDLNIRKAVIANSDRVALRNTRGGELLGPVANHFIPPLIPGFEEAGGLEAPEGLDFLASEEGDPELAAEYMKKAGFESGKCEGSECRITMVGDDSPPGRDTATVFADQLEQLGFDVQFQPVEHSLMYTKFCSIPSNQPDVCPNVGFIKDCNDPECFFDIPWYGPSINPDNNSNWGRLDDPEVNKKIEEARLLTDLDERAQAYGELDKLVMSKAAVLPWVFDNDVVVRSPDVNLVMNLFNALVDISYTSIRQ